jgi:hypothetical protein
MKSKTKNNWQKGAGHLVVIIACLVIVGLFAIGWTVTKQQQRAKQSNLSRSDTVTPSENAETNNQNAGQDISWQGTNDGGWIATGGTPPKCPNPILKNSPVETAKVSSVLLPGQYRGSHFKAHGGFRFDNAANNAVTVKLPMDAKLTGLTRYYEVGLHSGQQELQYLLTFTAPCGITIRYDHLATLTADFSKIAETTPAPELDNTRSLPLQDQPSFKAGTVVATNVGSPNGSNTGMDFGVYDLRKQNDISKNATWAALHKSESGQTFFAVCWLDWLPKADAARANALMAELPASHKGASDYCSKAPGGSTLKYNNGQPVQ